MGTGIGDDNNYYDVSEHVPRCSTHRSHRIIHTGASNEPNTVLKRQQEENNLFSICFVCAFLLTTLVTVGSNIFNMCARIAVANGNRQPVST